MTTAEARLLVVDDEPAIVDLLATALRFAGFEVRTADGGMAALTAVRSWRPDALLLDVMMPDVDGFEVTRRLRAEGRAVPVLFLTARDATDDTVAGLAVGGDDYVTKPFSLEEVVARVRAVLRRTSGAVVDDRIVVHGELVLDDGAHEVSRAGVPLELTPTEFDLLRFLLDNAGRVVSRQQILDHVWGGELTGEGGVVESYVSYLRKKVDAPFPTAYIRTVRGVGYCLRAPEPA